MNTLIILISFVKAIGILLTICGTTGLTLTFLLRKGELPPPKGRGFLLQRHHLQ